MTFIKQAKSEIHGSYRLDVQNDSFVQAIIKYNQEIVITGMQDIFGGKYTSDVPIRYSVYTGQDLPRLAEEMRARGMREIILNFVSRVTLSSIGILPLIQNNRDFKQMFSLQMKKASQRLQELSLNRPISREPLFTRPISRDEALTFALKTTQNVQGFDSTYCTGAIELPDLQTIVFEYQNGHCYYLTYGEHSVLCKMNNLILDLNDGFILLPTPKGVINSIEQTIVDRMQPYFSAWTNSNYQGSLFPQEIAPNMTNTTTVDSFKQPIHFEIKVPNASYQLVLSEVYKTDFDLAESENKLMVIFELNQEASATSSNEPVMRQCNRILDVPNVTYALPIEYSVIGFPYKTLSDFKLMCESDGVHFKSASEITIPEQSVCLYRKITPAQVNQDGRSSPHRDGFFQPSQNEREETEEMQALDHSAPKDLN